MTGLGSPVLRSFGQTGEKVCPVGLAVAQVGYQDDAARSDALRRALDLGCTLWDATHETPALQEAAERAIGAALSSSSGAQAARRAFVVTRVPAPPHNEEARDEWGRYGASRVDAFEHVRTCAARSLRNLGTDSIELLLYQPDAASLSSPSFEDGLRALRELQESGKARHIGLSLSSALIGTSDDTSSGRGVAAGLVERASKVIRLSALGAELSPWAPWATHPGGALDAAREAGLVFLATDPLGALSSAEKTRFGSPAMQLGDELRRLGAAHSTGANAGAGGGRPAGPAHVALGWALAQSQTVFPILALAALAGQERDAVDVAAETASGAFALAREELAELDGKIRSLAVAERRSNHNISAAAAAGRFGAPGSGAGSGMGGSLAGVDLGPSMLSAAGPSPVGTGPAIPAGTAPGGTPTTALSVYHLITQLCQRPDPADVAAAAAKGAAKPGSATPTLGAGLGQGSAAENLPGSSMMRENALLELSKKREQYEDLALVLWHSFGVMSSLLQEIISVYPLLGPPSLTAHASNRVCNALALLQCVASHNETRGLFLQAHIPLFLYPFLNTTSKTRPFEYLRLTSLGVIGALVKQNDNSDVITFLLSTEIIPLCLRIMETGSELSKTVAIFIVQKILLDDMGLAYICQTYERFYAVGTVLSNMVAQIVESQAVRLLKHVVRCYLRLSDNPRAREALRACLPGPLRDATFSQLLKNDHITKRCLATLLLNLSDRVES